MPSLRIYDTKGNEHSPTDDTGRTNDRIKDLFYDGVRLTVETGRETTFTLFIRARETTNARTEQFYAVYSTRDGSITDLIRALRDRVEREWGYAIDDSADDMGVFRALDTGATSHPGTNREQSILTELLGSRTRTTIGVRDAESALGVISQFTEQYDRAAIADSPESSALSSFDLVVAPDGSQGIVPLEDTEDRWESTKESLRSEHIDQEIASIKDSVQALSREYELSNSEIRRRVTRRVPALNTPQSGDSRSDSLTNVGSSSRFDLATIGKYAAVGAVVILLLVGVIQLGLLGGDGASVSGTVVDSEGEPIETQTTVELRLNNTDADNNTVDTEDGEFQFDNVGRGSYTVSVSSDKFVYENQEVMISEDSAESTDITIEPSHGIVTGDVTADDTSVNATITLVNGTGATVDETNDSSFEFEVPLTGAHYLEVTRNGYEPVNQSIDSFGEQSITLTSAPETQTGSLSGAVVNTETKDAIIGATVEVIDTDDSTEMGVNNYSIDGLSPGEYTVRISADDYASRNQSVTITSSGTERDFELGAPASASGTITNESDDPLDEATVTLVRREDNQDIAQTTTGSDGTYRFSSVSFGEYQIEVTRQGYENETVRPVSLNPGEDYERPIPLTPA